MARWKLSASTTFEILPHSTCTLCLEKSYISKGIQPIFEILASARRCWGWAFGRKVSGAPIFYFCNGKVKTFRIENIGNILRLSTCTLCKQKSYISKGIQPIFEIFTSARRRWGWAFGWKVSGAPVFCFCNGMVKTLRIDNILNFATFNLYTVPAKMLYLQKYSTDFRNPCLNSKMLRVGILGRKFQERRYFTFAMPTWKLWASRSLEILPLSSCTLCKQKSYISKGIQTIFEILGSARRRWGWAFGWKVSGAQIFYFCNGKVKTLRIDNIWNFANLNQYTVPAKNPISPKVFKPIFKIFASARRCWGCPFGWKVLCAQVFYFCNAEVNIFALRQQLKFCNFQPVHCTSKNPISRKVFNRFSKSLPQLEDVQGGHLGGKF